MRLASRSPAATAGRSRPPRSSSMTASSSSSSASTNAARASPRPTTFASAAPAGSRAHTGTGTARRCSTAAARSCWRRPAASSARAGRRRSRPRKETCSRTIIMTATRAAWPSFSSRPSSGAPTAGPGSDPCRNRNTPPPFQRLRRSGLSPAGRCPPGHTFANNRCWTSGRNLLAERNLRGARAVPPKDAERSSGMKIAQIAPLIESVPPKLYGGTERIVSYLTEELVRQGHEVTLFASGDSETAAELIPCVPEGLRLAQVGDPLPYSVLQLEKIRRRAGDFDIAHFHADFLHFPLARSLGAPTVTTLHGRLDLPFYRPLLQEF